MDTFTPSLSLARQERLALLGALWSLGDCIELKVDIDIDALAAELEIYENSWVPYNPLKPNHRRTALSLTSLDGGISGDPDLTSIAEYNRQNGTKLNELSFSTKTSILHHCKSLHELFSLFEGNLGRCHLLKLDAGGFFPPHRDGSPLHAIAFRVFVPLFRCKKLDMVFLMDEQRLSFEMGRPYVLNTYKAHSLFSFSERSIHLVMNIALNETSVSTVIKHLKQR